MGAHRFLSFFQVGLQTFNPTSGSLHYGNRLLLAVGIENILCLLVKLYCNFIRLGIVGWTTQLFCAQKITSYLGLS